MVRRINHAIGTIAGNPHVANYLDAVYAEELGKTSGIVESAFQGVHDGFCIAYEYFAEDFPEKLIDAMRGWDEKRRIAFSAAINTLWFKRLIFDIDGDAPTATWFDQLFELCLKKGLDLKQVMRPDVETVLVRRKDCFELVVRRELSRAVPNDVNLRNALRAIVGAYNDVLRQHEKDYNSVLEGLYRTLTGEEPLIEPSIAESESRRKSLKS